MPSLCPHPNSTLLDFYFLSFLFLSLVFGGAGWKVERHESGSGDEEKSLAD